MDNDWENDLYQKDDSNRKRKAEEEIEVEVGDMMSSIEKYLHDIRTELIRGRHTMAGLGFILMVLLFMLQECRA
tara:strand:- start:1993 stop:2214 length:222 start_codon:yes stop_codon:yes gene_type:complete